MKLAVEKAVECGVKSISPIILDRCIPRKLKLEKYQSIAKAAVKQCGRSIIPELHSVHRLKDWIQAMQSGAKVVCSKDGTDTLIDISNPGQERIYLLIGPEGDFTTNELNILIENKFKFVSLGARRLRSETAVVASIAIINSVYK